MKSNIALGICLTAVIAGVFAVSRGASPYLVTSMIAGAWLLTGSWLGGGLKRALTMSRQERIEQALRGNAERGPIAKLIINGGIALAVVSTFLMGASASNPVGSANNQ